MTCGQIEPLLTRYLLDDLDPATRDSVAMHIAACEHCRAEIAALGPTVTLLKETLGTHTAPVHRLDPARRERILRTVSPRREQRGAESATISAISTASQAGTLTRSAPKTRRGVWQHTDTGKPMRMTAFPLRQIVEAAAAVMILLAMAGLFMPALSRSREAARKASVAENAMRWGAPSSMDGRKTRQVLPEHEGLHKEEAVKSLDVTVSASAPPAATPLPKAKAVAGADYDVDEGLSRAGGSTRGGRENSLVRQDRLFDQPGAAGSRGVSAGAYVVNGEDDTRAHRDTRVVERLRGAFAEQPAGNTDRPADSSPKLAVQMTMGAVSKYGEEAMARDRVVAGDVVAFKPVAAPEASVAMAPPPVVTALGLEDSSRKKGLGGKEQHDFGSGLASALPSDASKASRAAGSSRDGTLSELGATMTKSPMITRGLYGNRSKGGRQVALSISSGGSVKTDDRQQLGDADMKTRDGIAPTEQAATESLRPREEDLPQGERLDIHTEVAGQRLAADRETEAVKAGSGILAYGLAAPTAPAPLMLAQTKLPLSGGREEKGDPPAASVAPAPVSGGVVIAGSLGVLIPDKPERDEGTAESKTTRLPVPLDFNPVVDCSENRFSTFAIDVDTASFGLTRRALLGGQLPTPETVRVEEFVNAFEYAYPSPERRTFAVYTDRARSPFRPNLELLRIGVRGKVIGRDRQRASVLTFVVDTSGSMNTPDRLPLIQQSLKLLVDQLKPADSVAIVAFGSQARLVLDQTPASSRQAILGAIDSLQASGSTHLEAGLRLGYETAASHFSGRALNRVLLLSDGVANLGAGTAQEILAQVDQYRKQGIYSSVFGFGQGTYDDAMLETLADKGDGVYAFVDSPAEAKRVLVDDLAATLYVIARDVKIQVEFDPARVRSYRQLGYENRHLEKEQFRDDAVDAGEVGSGQSVTALYELDVVGDANDPLGTVRVRWKDPETGRVEELAHPIRASDLYGAFKQAPVRFRLAAGVAEFADWLRGNPAAGGTDADALLEVLRPVACELHLDRQVQDVLAMATEAARLRK